MSVNDSKPNNFGGVLGSEIDRIWSALRADKIVAASGVRVSRTTAGTFIDADIVQPVPADAWYRVTNVNNQHGKVITNCFVHVEAFDSGTGFIIPNSGRWVITQTLPQRRWSTFTTISSFDDAEPSNEILWPMNLPRNLGLDAYGWRFKGYSQRRGLFRWQRFVWSPFNRSGTHFERLTEAERETWLKTSGLSWKNCYHHGDYCELGTFIKSDTQNKWWIGTESEPYMQTQAHPNQLVLPTRKNSTNTDYIYEPIFHEGQPITQFIAAGSYRSQHGLPNSKWYKNTPPTHWINEFKTYGRGGLPQTPPIHWRWFDLQTYSSSKDNHP